jgi:GDP-4-dehydro-6-deoxy-D-mannose reductase
MKKILITGISGFVGGYVVDHLASRNDMVEIHGISRSKPAWKFIPARTERCKDHHFHSADLNDLPKIQSLIEKIQPDQILHLAAQSSVGESWNSPVASFVNNTTIFLNIIEAARLMDTGSRVLSVGSSEQYGVVSETDLPLKEDYPQRPANPYAVARVAQEQLARVYGDGFGMDICCTRSFNHCGPGQTDRFVAGAISKQFARISLGLQDPVIDIGDGTIVRDFLDVRDVVSAYTLLLENGKSGQVYNICSGRGCAISELVTLLSDRLQIPVEIHQNPMRKRPQDIPRIIGSYEKIHRELGWHPRIPLADSLQEMSVYWKELLKRERGSG